MFEALSDAARECTYLENRNLRAKSDTASHEIKPQSNKQFGWELRHTDGRDDRSSSVSSESRHRSRIQI